MSCVIWIRQNERRKINVHMNSPTFRQPNYMVLQYCACDLVVSDKGLFIAHELNCTLNSELPRWNTCVQN